MSQSSSYDAIARASLAIVHANAKVANTALDLRKAHARMRRDASPSDGLALVRRAWNAQTQDPGNRLSERELAEAMRVFAECWLEEGCAGEALSEATTAYRVWRVNYKQVKACLTQLASWTKKSAWAPWTDACRAMREEIMKKAEGEYHTYAQVYRGFDLLRSQATIGVRNMVNNAGSQILTLEDAKAFDADLKKWMARCWSENGLPVLEHAPKDNEVFYASGLEPTMTLSTTSTRVPPRDRSQPVSPALPSAKKAKTERQTPPQKPTATEVHELPSSIGRDQPKSVDMPPIATQLASSKPSSSDIPAKQALTKETSMHVTRNAVGVLVKAKCHGLNIDLVIIPPFPLLTSLKTNGEMAAMVFRETQAEKDAITPPVASSVRCTHNDGKMWRCPDRCCENLPFCIRHRPRSFATMMRVHPVTFQTPHGLTVTYDGPPAACVVRSVAGAPIDDSDLLMLKDADNLEVHAWNIETQLQSAEGLVREESVEGRFRANALVRERDGVWVPYPLYEARLLTLLPGIPPGCTAVSESVFNASIEDIRAINLARAEMKVTNPPLVQDERGDKPITENETLKPVPTGCQDVRQRLAELRQQMNGVCREILAMKDTGKEHVVAQGGWTSAPTESEYEIFERSVNRALVHSLV